MVSPRLSLILDGYPAPTSVVVFRPRADVDLSMFGDASVQIVQGFKPDHDAFAGRGFDVRTAPQGQFDLAVVAVPRSKLEARALIHAATVCASRVVVDGQKLDGIDSIVKDIKKRAETVEVVSKAHGKAIAFEGGDFADWADPGPLSKVEGFTTRLGVFSVDRIDKASEFLIENLPEKMPAKLADLGAGWGFLSRHLLTLDGVKSLDVVEAEHTAFLCAQDNLDDLRATFHWTDATTFKPATKLDGVVMNPPFHTSRAADPALGQAFIAAAAGMLAPHGQLWLVANRQLPYEKALAASFLHVEQIVAQGGFKIMHASKPLRDRAKRA